MASRVGQQLGNYRLIRLLGEGGFAEVYLGEHIHLGTQAAIKVLHARLAGKDAPVSFNQEARLIAQLKHPHIVRTLDFGVADNTPFLVMDYAPQGTLRQRHPKGSKIPLATVVTYVEQIAEGLQYAHEHKIIHRDIKPENLLIGKRGELLLSDFGIAVIAHSTRSQSVENLAGTIAYMSPEQIQGKPRPASDQYALGIIVYEWLCGERPFKGTFTEIAAQHATIMPPSLRSRMPISQEIEQIIFKALAKDSAQRFGCVKDFAEALQQAYKAEYAAVTQRAEGSRALQNNPLQLKIQEIPMVSSSLQKTSSGSLSQMRAATPPASLPPSLIPPSPPVTEQSLQPRQKRKPKPPIVLPLRRGKLKVVDLFVVPGYWGLSFLFMLALIYFSPQRSTALGLIGTILFGTLISVTILLTGPLLGSIRGALAIILFNASVIIYYQIQFGIQIASYSSGFWIGQTIWIAIELFMGWIYEKRQKRNFIISWVILVLETIGVLALIEVFSSNIPDSNVIVGLGILAFLVSLITAALEAALQVIVASILKKKQQV